MADSQTRRYQQFAVAVLFVVIGVACAWVAVACYLGLVFAVLLLVLMPVLLTLAVIWACAYVHVPVLTKVATLFGVLGGTLLLALPCYLVEAREDARRLQCGNQLRQLGEDASQNDMLHPGDR